MKVLKKIKSLMMRYVPMMTTCEKAHAFIDDYLAGELPAKSRRIFELHIRLCGECHAYLDHYREAIRLGKNYFHDQPDEACELLPDELNKAILSANKNSQT